MKFRAAAVAAALAVTTAACAGNQAGFEGAAPPIDGATHSTRSMRSVLAYQEIVDYGMSGGASLYNALERLRPEFLRPRRPSPSAMRGHTPEVYIESMRAGGLEVLHTIPIAHVKNVRYIRPVDALIRYGTLRDHDGGVILVTLERH